jgi:transposase
VVGGADRPGGQLCDNVAGRASAGMDAYKKTLAASERNAEDRSAWRQALATHDPQHLVFVDETSTHTSLIRLYGWAPHDQRAVGKVPRTHGKNTTLVAALSAQGLQAPWAIAGAMDTRAFATYVTQVLLPTLQPGQVVVLDNLSVHKARGIREAITHAGYEVLYLPAYSPDFTPIEQAFSKLKAILRGLGERTREALLEAVARAVDAITQEDVVGWFTHAGYPLPVTSP